MVRKREIAWPAVFLRLMRLMLHPEPQPPAEQHGRARRWLLTPPPPMVAALLALRIGPTEARIFLDQAGVDPRSQLVLRRAVGQAPAGPMQGDLIVEGAFKTAVQDKQAPPGQSVFYAAFAQLHAGNEAVYSPSAIAELLDPSKGSLQRLAESAASQAFDSDEVPGRVRLCFRAMEPAVAAEALLASGLPWSVPGPCGRCEQTA